MTTLGQQNRARPEPVSTRVVHATCSLDCPDSCGVLVTVQTDGQGAERAVKIAGDPAHPVTRGFLCGKVAKFLDRVYAPDRVLYPMRRRPGVAKGPLPKGQETQAFERIGWDEALDGIARKLEALAQEWGPESVLPYSYAGTIGQLGYGSMDRRFFYRLGASQLDRTICASAGAEALTRVYGTRLGTPPQDFAHAGMVVAWGANIHGNNIHLWPFIEQARRDGARLVVIDPYRTRTAALADEHLGIRPGTDALLALGLMHLIFREGLEDRAYLDACTHGADQLRTHALHPDHAPERVAAVTGLPAASIVRLALDLATCVERTGRPAAIRVNYGIQRAQNGGTAARAVAMLPLVLGSWKHRGGGLLLSNSGAFPFNAARLQMPELMLRSPLGRPARTVNMNELGTALNVLGTPDAAPHAGPPVKALFVYNCNAAAVAPNQNAVLRGLRRPDLFTVVHEQCFTDTADYADVLLPAPTFLETRDVQGSYGHLFAQLSQQALAPLGEARSNVDLFGALGRRLFPDEPCFADSADDLIDAALDSPDPRFAGITRQSLQQHGHLALTMPVDGSGDSLPFSNASWFRTPHGRAELLPVPVFEPPVESRPQPPATAGQQTCPTLQTRPTLPTAADAFPLEFLPRKADNFMNTTFANQPTHQRLEARTEGVLEMHATDAAARGLANGDPVEIFNARGSLTLRAQLSDRVRPGVVAARLDWSKLGHDLSGRGNNVNALTSERLTDIGGGATFYSTLVEVRRAELP